MRLSRGSSFKGYAGINKITKTKDYLLVEKALALLLLDTVLSAKNGFATSQIFKSGLFVASKCSEQDSIYCLISDIHLAFVMPLISTSE